LNFQRDLQALSDHNDSLLADMKEAREALDATLAGDTSDSATDSTSDNSPEDDDLIADEAGNELVQIDAADLDRLHGDSGFELAATGAAFAHW